MVWWPPYQAAFHTVKPASLKSSMRNKTFGVSAPCQLSAVASPVIAAATSAAMTQEGNA